MSVISFFFLLLGEGIIFFFSQMVFAYQLHTIIIDPGHGGNDHGANYYGVKESDLTLLFALQLQKKLTEAGYKSVSTRNTNRHLSLLERAQIARNESGELFLSIHFNSSEDTGAHGMEIYFENQLPADEESMFLANKENMAMRADGILDWPLRPILPAHQFKGDLLQILKDLQRSHRIQLSSVLALQLVENWQGTHRSIENTIHQAPFYVINNVNMPSVLIEVGFLSNPKEAKLLSSATFRENIINGIIKGIKGYQEKMDKVSINNLFIK